MEGSVGAPPQRVCPKCARLSWATGPRCPYCRGRFARRTTATFAWMLAAAVVVTLAGVLALLIVAGNIAEKRLDDKIDAVQKNFDTTLGQLRSDVQRQLDERLPAAGALPTATPAVTATPTAAPSPTVDGTTASPTPTATTRP